MRCLVVYSTRTGNTKMIAEAIADVMPAGSVLAPVETAPQPDSFDLICLGFWVDKGAPDGNMETYMKKVVGKQVGLFGTLGAWPDSDHARDCIERAKAMLPGNTILGAFLSQGRINPKILFAMKKMREAQKLHPMTEERKARIKEAEKHPNAEDCADARKCFSAVVKQAQQNMCVQ